MKKIKLASLLMLSMWMVVISGTGVFANEEGFSSEVLTAQEGALQPRAIITSYWGTSEVDFDESSGVLTVKAGTLSSSPYSEYLDSGNTIKKNDVKKIVLEAGIVAPADSSYLFSGIYAFNNLENIEGTLNTSNVTNMSHMFGGVGKLTSLDLTDWDTSQVTNMEELFSSASLVSLDVSNWDTANVTNMNYLFGNMYSLASLDVSNWNTSNVTNMKGLFLATRSLTELNIGQWNTSKVTDMSSMFHGSGGLTALDINQWDTKKVTDMSFMFHGAEGLTTLDISQWDTSQVTNMKQMFFFSLNLTSLNISGWDTSSLTEMSSMFYYTNLQELTLGAKSIFNSTAGLQAILSDGGKYTRGWERINPDSPVSVYASSDNFLNNYDGSMPGTYSWQKASYTIYYYLNGGTNSADNPTQYTYGTGVASFVKPTRDGYTFVKWIEDGITIDEVSTTTVGDKYLTAIWEESTYNIVYELNGGKNNSNNPTEYTYGTGVANFEDPTKEGYKFLGWVDDSGASITNISVAEFGDKTLTAKWEKVVSAGSKLPNSETTSVKGTITSAPSTGDSNTHSSMMLLMVGLLISGGYLATRKKR